MAVGSSTMTASVGSISGSGTLNVGPATLQSITITPQDATIGKGTTLEFTATGNYSDSSTQDLTALVTWTSSDSTLVSITSAGLATARQVWHRYHHRDLGFGDGLDHAHRKQEPTAIDCGDAGDPVHHRRTNAAVHSDRHVLRQQYPGPDQDCALEFQFIRRCDHQQRYQRRWIGDCQRHRHYDHQRHFPGGEREYHSHCELKLT